MKWITETRVMWAIAITLIATTIIDMYTAFTSPVFFIAETNPIFLLFGSRGPLVLITIFATIWIITTINKSISLFRLYVFSLIFIYLSFGHLLGAYSNIVATQKYEQNATQVLELYEETTTKEKIKSYNLIVGIFMLLPVGLSVLAFFITNWLYHRRKPERDKLTIEIKKLADKIYLK
ncbi:hypothetical protein LCGC14_1656540 [marine sediment metagenome]|uniref:Uncharacterized protein n=1 Tax=marine sediment metagenome TaxID=412755 RepID=A0A0F9IHU0_9ZZZZ